MFNPNPANALTDSVERKARPSPFALSLLLGQSREALLNVESTVMPGKMRVSPGNPEESTLWLAVGSGESDEWAFSHRELLTPDRRDLILSWISR